MIVSLYYKHDVRSPTWNRKASPRFKPSKCMCWSFFALDYHHWCISEARDCQTLFKFCLHCVALLLHNARERLHTCFMGLYSIPFYRNKHQLIISVQPSGACCTEKLCANPAVMTPCTWPAVPSWLSTLTGDIQRHTAFFPTPINHVLVNEYLPGHGIMVCNQIEKHENRNFSINCHEEYLRAHTSDLLPAAITKTSGTPSQSPV